MINIILSLYVSMKVSTYSNRRDIDLIMCLHPYEKHAERLKSYILPSEPETKIEDPLFLCYSGTFCN